MLGLHGNSSLHGNSWSFKSAEKHSQNWHPFSGFSSVAPGWRDDPSHPHSSPVPPFPQGTPKEGLCCCHGDHPHPSHAGESGLIAAISGLGGILDYMVISKKC